MTRNVILWVLAFIITIASAVYQKKTGPTYPLAGETLLGGDTIEYKLDRSHGGDDDHKVSIEIPDKNINGILSYKRYKTDDPWTHKNMDYDGDCLVDSLPHQPPAGKLQYTVKLILEDKEVTIPETGPVIIRFKGDVPNLILIPHIIFMFTAMFVSMRAGLQALSTNQRLKTYALCSIFLTILGGLVFGPIVQKYAFGSYWTGFPFGIDLTDNKTLIAAIGWLIAGYAVFRNKRPRFFVLGASALMFIIFLIPHSALGSELDYSDMEIKQARIVDTPGYKL